MRTGGTAIRTALVGVVACLALAAASSADADSLTFIKESNVWLSNPDGSGQYQVTFDGSADAPYQTPSESDGGVVVAIRKTPGQRNQIYRMTQSGQLLNPPINTPAPGTGAIDAKVSPDGSLVAYWFVTTVMDPGCPFCIVTSNRVLLSHSDRFTNADEVGTPNTGGFPSWIDDQTIMLGDGTSSQWYYRLGMPEAAEWFDDTDITGVQSFNTLLDAEAAPTGDRLAVVRGDSQETIAILKMNGPPPTKPSPGGCSLEGPAGKFVDPTWSSDGRLLAWQEDNGVWTIPVPANPLDCAGYGTPTLRIPGAKNPDLSAAALNPGPRPPCGNPGNPTPCTTTTPPSAPPPPAQPPAPAPGPDLKLIRGKLNGLLATTSGALRAAKLAGLVKAGKVKLKFQAPAAGTLSASLTAGAGHHLTDVATGSLVFANAGSGTLLLKVTHKGAKLIGGVHTLTVTLLLSFKPKGSATTVTAKQRLTLSS
ncbi:MAG: hypothetical protein JST53_14390 [Actinobacteria bacterium]|nr:hypothetical protein [Actinomycetota bacterium]